MPPPAIKLTLLIAWILSRVSHFECLQMIKTVNEKNPNRTRLFACPELKVDIAKVRVLFASNWTKSGENLSFGLDSGFENCNKSFFVSFTNKNKTTRNWNTDLENIDENGILRLQNDFYQPYEYCIYETKVGQVTLKVCAATCTGRRPCIAKCCSVGKSIDYVNGEGCVEDTTIPVNEWKLEFYKNPHRRLSSQELSRIKPHVKQLPPKCYFPNGTMDANYETLPSVDVPQLSLNKMSMRLRKDGSLLYLGTHRSWEVLPWNNFCIDYILLEDPVEDEVDELMMADSSQIERPFVVLKCVQFFEKTGRLSIFYVIAMFTAAFFLLLTGSVYALLWDKHNIHGWTIFCHVISMFFLYVLLGISHAFGLAYEFDDLIDQLTSCVFIGAAVHFFFVSTFCWLTLINFDLWATFRCVTPIGERSRGVRRFVLYNVFAWGIGGTAVAVGVTMDFLYPDVYSEVIVPQYGQTNCFMASWAMGYYVYSVIGVLMMINFVFIFLTSWTIYKFRETAHMIQHSKSEGPMQSFKLFSKLFVIMGVTWALEIVSWLTIGEKTTLYWTLLDCVNILQAIAIFVIFICKHKTLRQLQQKFTQCSHK